MNSDDPFDLPHRDYGKARYTLNIRIMVSALIVLLLVVVLVILLHVYARWFWRQSARLPRRRSASRRRRFHFRGQEPARLLNVGLDSAIIETLPMFLYKAQDFTDGLDCAVCLCEFQENEKARLMPNCRHSFHVECIDMWFRSHSTCPVCRTSAQPEQPILESIRIEQVSATIPGSISSGINDNLNSEHGRQQTAVSGEDYNVQNPTNIFSWDRQKQMNAKMEEGSSGGRASIMSQIGIEIPKRPNDFSSLGEGHQFFSPNGSQSSSRSPVTRLRSLTRMLSRDTERIHVFLSDHPAECDAGNNCPAKGQY